jgi:putative transposase
MRYRRADIAGATYFFTVNLADRKSHLLVEQIDLLRNVIRQVRQSHSFTIVAMVILPDHCMPFGSYHQAMPISQCVGP